MGADDERRAACERVRRHVTGMLKEAPGLHVNDTASSVSTWVSWDGRGDIGYWVGAGMSVNGTARGYVIVSWVDGSDDEREGPDPRREILHCTIPGNAVGDGAILGLMAINALQADRDRQEAPRD